MSTPPPESSGGLEENSPTAGVSRQIDNSRETGGATRRRRILAAGGFAHFVHDGFTDSLYVLLPFWADAFGLSHAQVGSLKMVVAGALSAFQVPAGFLAERFGERTVLTLGTITVGAAFIALGFAGGFLGLLLLLVIVGGGGGTQHPLVSSVVSRAYAGGGRRGAIGTYNFAGDLGKMTVPATVAVVAAAIGWRESTLAAGVFGLIAGFAVYAVFRRLAVGSPPPRHASKARAARPKGWAKGWGIADPRGYASLSAISMVDLTIRYAFLTFMPFLLIGKGAAAETVGFALALVFAGGAAGKLICGFIAERLGILRTVVLTEVATGGAILLLIALPMPVALFLLPLLGLALNGTSSVLYGTVAEFVDADRQSRAYGLFYTLGVGTGAVAPFFYGLIGDRWGIDTTLTVIAASALLILPLCLVLRKSLA